jgi:hypothetical protein
MTAARPELVRCTSTHSCCGLSLPERFHGSDPRFGSSLPLSRERDVGVVVLARS